MKNSTSKKTAFNKVNEAVIEGLKTEGLKWFKPWRMADGSLYAPLNYGTRRNYTGVNRMLLTAIARAEGYESGEWATYKAIAEAGGQVRKGEKGTGIVYWNRSFKVTETGKWFPNERAVIKAGYKLPQDVQNKTLTEAWSLISHTVFNIQQADGIESKATGEIQNPEHVEIPKAEGIYNNYPNKPTLAHGGDSAHYVPSRDHVQMPKPEAFVDTSSYYKTLFHELVHSTGHKDRLNRDTLTKVNSWGDELYSREELVAEIGAWYLTGLCGLEPKDSELNSQAYINGWIKNLENKEREAVYAIGQATKAVEHILEGKGAKAPKTPKKVSKEPVLASKQVDIKKPNILAYPTNAKKRELSNFDHTAIQQCKLDIKAIDHCFNNFNLNKVAKQQLQGIRDEAVYELLSIQNQDEKLTSLNVPTDGDAQNEQPLQKYLENIYQKTAVKILDFTIWDALKTQAIAVAEVDGQEFYYIYNTTFGGEEAVGYVNIYRNEFRLHSKQVTVKQVAEAVKDTSNYFDKGSMAFFNQKLSDFKIESIEGGKYFLYAPSYWDGELMGFSCIVYNSNKNILESINVDDSEKSSPEAIAELIERLRAENVEHKVYSKQVTIKKAESYAFWLLRECSCPVDEITFLVSTILESDNKHVIEEVIEQLEIDEEQKLYSKQVTVKDSTAEDNKLIAEFMELKCVDGSYRYTTHFDDHFTDKLCFNSSWDWLMPVVEKCLTTNEPTDGQHYFINDAILTCNIEVVFDRVVCFIKEYNDRTKQTNKKKHTILCIPSLDMEARLIPNEDNLYGYANGYVGVQKKHSLYGLNYQNYNDKGVYLLVHGGVTFTGHLKSPTSDENSPNWLDEDYWWIGFDTRHSGDTAEEHDFEYCLEELTSLACQIATYKEGV